MKRDVIKCNKNIFIEIHLSHLGCTYDSTGVTLFFFLLSTAFFLASEAKKDNKIRF